MSATAASATPASSTGAPGKGAVWTGRVLSALVALVMLMSASMKLSGKADIVTAFTGHYGYPAGSITIIGVVEIACVVLYLIPRSSVFGAILVTGYLGGAVSTHVRAGEPFLIPIAVGVVAWLGLYLREGRLRMLAPMRVPG